MTRQAKSKSNLQVKSSAPSSYDHTISPDTLENTFQIYCFAMQHRIGHESHVASALNKLPRCQNEVPWLKVKVAPLKLNTTYWIGCPCPFPFVPITRKRTNNNEALKSMSNSHAMDSDGAILMRWCYSTRMIDWIHKFI